MPRSKGTTSRAFTIASKKATRCSRRLPTGARKHPWRNSEAVIAQIAVRWVPITSRANTTAIPGARSSAMSTEMSRIRLIHPRDRAGVDRSGCDAPPRCRRRRRRLPPGKVRGADSRAAARSCPVLSRRGSGTIRRRPSHCASGSRYLRGRRPVDQIREGPGGFRDGEGRFMGNHKIRLSDLQTRRASPCFPPCLPEPVVHAGHVRLRRTPHRHR